MSVQNIDKRRFVFAVLVSASIALTARAAAQPALKWEPFALETAAGKAAAELGRITVPERRNGSSKATIDLALVRIKSQASKPLPPLVYLDGGPGGDGYTVAQIDSYADLFERIRETRDVILLSQRGTGLSRPRPSCAIPDPLPDDFFLSEETMTRELTRRGAECAATLRAQGIDLAAYNTEETADDVEDVRKALGVDRVALFGFSYGTHAALTVLRRWPASIDRVVLAGTEGPSHTWKLPRTMDQQFGKLAAEAGGDLAAAWQRLLARSAAEPLRIAIDVRGTARTVLVGPAGLQFILRRDIGDTNDWPVLPAAITQAEQGDLSLLTRAVARRFTGFTGGIALMPIAMDCASGASRERLEVIARQEPSPFFGRMTNFPFPGACGALELPMLPDTFRGPVTSDVPALFISGTHDSNTPPSQAELVASRFSRASHLIVENAGHESTLVAEVRDAIVSFLRSDRVESRRLSAPPVKFLPVSRD